MGVLGANRCSLSHSMSLSQYESRHSSSKTASQSCEHRDVTMEINLIYEFMSLAVFSHPSLHRIREIKYLLYVYHVAATGI